jgi:hypothetical protein
MIRIALLLATAHITFVCPAIPVPMIPGQTQQSQPAVASVEIAGKWHFTLNTDGGDRDVEALFKVDGDQLTGKWDTTDVKGTYKDGDLELAFPLHSEEAGMTATLKVKGKLKDGRLIGNWEYSEYSGTFTATKGK